MDLLELIQSKSNSSLSSTQWYNDCKKNLTEENIFEIMKYHTLSGRLFFDSGDEFDCSTSGYDYVLLKLELCSDCLNFNQDGSLLKFLSNDGAQNFLTFLQKNYTYIGFCIFKDCKQTVFDVFNDTINEDFKLELLEKTSLNITTYNLDISKFLNKKYPNTDFVIFFSLIGFYLFVKIGFILYSFTDKTIRKELIVMPYNISLLTEFKINSKEKKLPATELIKYFSFMHQMEILRNDLDTYFNDRKLIYLHLIRLIIIQMLNIYNSFLTFFVTPKFSSDTFWLLKSYTFNIIKISYFISNTVYFINGVFFSYKLLALIFKYKSYSLKNFLYFYLHVLLKMVPITLILYMIYSFGNEFIYFFSSRPILSKSTFSELYNSRESRILKDGVIIEYLKFFFSYIYINLFSYHYSNGIQPFLQIIFFCLNDFFIFTFSTLVFYLLFRFKNKYLDWIYFFSVFSLLAKIYYNYDNSSLSYNMTTTDNEPKPAYNFFQIIYNLNSIGKIDHSYICYFIGNLTGILFFFHNIVDFVIDDILIRDFKNYIPFKFILQISFFFNNKFRNKKRGIMKFILIFMILLGILLSFNFNFLKDSSLLLEVNTYNTLMSRFELIFFNCIFAIFIYCSFFIITINEIKGKKLILLISRGFYIFIPLSHIINYYVYVFFQIDMDVYFSNILFFNIATFLIINILCLIFLLLFEIPIRILFKRKIKKFFGFSIENNF